MDRLPLWRRLRRRFYWLLVWCLLRLAEVLPLAWGRHLCTALARLAFRLRRKERVLAAENLARALPEETPAARREILTRAVDHLGPNLVHTLAAARMLRTPGAVIEEFSSPADNKSIGDWLVELADAGRGVFVLTGHIGCWELAGGRLAQIMRERNLGTLGVITGTIHNPAVDRLIQRQRRNLGVHVLPREAGARPLVRFLKDGGVVAVLQDQNIRARNLDVPFFGLPTPTPVGMAALALRYGIPVLPVVGVWDESRRVQVMHHLPPIRPEKFASDDQFGFLKCCNSALETFIRRNPEQWVWFHRRWNPER